MLGSMSEGMATGSGQLVQQPVIGGQLIQQHVVGGQMVQQPVADIARAIAEAIRMVRDTPATVPPVVQQPHKGVDIDLKQFLELNTLAFHGGISPIKTEDWIKKIETIFQVMHCPEERKVELTTFLFENEVRRWCDDLMAKKLATKEKMMTWSKFVQEFTNWFVPPAEKRRLREKFLRLVQGNMTISEYEAEFSSLAYYAGSWVDSEADRCFLFQQGLRDSIRSYLIPLYITDYATLVDTARKIELDQERTSPVWVSQSETESSSAGSKCSKCGKVHKGQCLQGTSFCFLCRQPGHRQYGCPKKTAPKGSEKVTSAFRSQNIFLMEAVPKEQVMATSSRGSGVSSEEKKSQARILSLGQQDVKTDDTVVTGDTASSESSFTL